MCQEKGQKLCWVTTGLPGSCLEKKPTINLWNCYTLCDLMWSYEKNHWEYEHVIKNIVLGTKYGWSTKINISNYEHLIQNQ